MWRSFCPLIPMLVHKIIYHATRCQRQVRVFVCGRGYGLDLCNEDDLVALWREKETFYIVFEAGEGVFADDYLSVLVYIA